MSTYSMEVDSFITEISKRRAIWDLSSEENKVKRLKDEAWMDVARAFVTDFDDMSETQKSDIYRKLQSKWRNLRDNYVRSTRRKDGLKMYAHSRVMTFLDPVYRHRPTRAEDKKLTRYRRPKKAKEMDVDDSQSLDDVLSDDTGSESKLYIDKGTIIQIKAESSNDEDTPLVTDNSKRKRNSPEFLEVPLDEIRLPTTFQDEDKLFFDSLLPVVHEFNTDQKLEFRTQILQLIKTIRSKQT